jgi:hypothetical protein
MRGAVTECIADSYAIGVEAIRADLWLADDAAAQIVQEIHGAFGIPLADAPANDCLLRSGHADENILIALILELTKAQRASSGDERRKRLHQFLSDIGVKALRQHLGQLLGIAQVSQNEAEYEKHVRRIFGVQYEMEFE